MRKSIALCAGLVLLAACAGPPGLDERRAAARAALPGGGGFEIVPTRTFDLAVQRLGPATGATLTVMIEGDGLAWLSRTRPSSDPTPTAPLALPLLARIATGPAAYLARPCQYVGAQSRNCDADYWTQRRFAPEVIAAADEAVSRLKAESGAAALHLMGYSGGGVVAALVAARRSDVARLTTFATPLDTAAFTAHHNVSPLTGSLSPVGDATALAAIPQRHFAGAADTVVPPHLVASYMNALGPGACARVHTLPGVSHGAGWLEAAAAIRAAPFACPAEGTS